MKKHSKNLSEGIVSVADVSIRRFIWPFIPGGGDFEWWTYHIEPPYDKRKFRVYQNGKGDLRKCLKEVKKATDKGYKEIPDSEDYFIMGVIFSEDNDCLSDNNICIEYNPDSKKYSIKLGEYPYFYFDKKGAK